MAVPIVLALLVGLFGKKLKIKQKHRVIFIAVVVICTLTVYMLRLLTNSIP